MRELFIKILMQIVTLVTPEVRRALCEGLKNSKESAKQTANPWDDLLFDMMIVLLDCDQK